jgi:hypothetical protein
MRRNFLQMFFKGAMLISTASIIFAGCAKDGNDGLAGPAGPAGKDASETCKLCHNPSVVDSVATQFQLSKHEFGLAAEEEAGSTTCGPCHLQEAFKYVCKNNTTAVFYQDSATGPWKNPYAVPTYAAYGKLGCFTCHSSLHTTYGYSDITSLTTVAPVQMTMWGGEKTINLTADGGQSNLCVKCHQPRPLTSTTTSARKGKYLDYPAIAANPTAVFYDSTTGVTTNLLTPGYRTHIHYGAVGAVVAGMGAVEFGTGYANSTHTATASCQDCHMAPMTGAAGGHSFKAKGNFNGCNNANCHKTGVSSGLMSATNSDFTAVRTEIKGLLNTLAGKLVEGGINIINKNGDAEHNLWYGLTTGNYDGYLNVYDPINNPDGATYNTAGHFRNMGSTSSWTAAQKAINNASPKLHLTNAQMGAIINFQFCLRGYSLGIHNYKYVKALLNNSIAVL